MSDRTSHPRYGTANGDTDPNQLRSRPHPTISHVPILCIANFGVLYRNFAGFPGGPRSRRASLLACVSECPFPEAIYELSACEFRGWQTMSPGSASDLCAPIWCDGHGGQLGGSPIIDPTVFSLVLSGLAKVSIDRCRGHAFLRGDACNFHT